MGAAIAGWESAKVIYTHTHTPLPFTSQDSRRPQSFSPQHPEINQKSDIARKEKTLLKVCPRFIKLVNKLSFAFAF